LGVIEILERKREKKAASSYIKTVKTRAVLNGDYESDRDRGWSIEQLLPACQEGLGEKVKKKPLRGAYITRPGRKGTETRRGAGRISECRCFFFVAAGKSVERREKGGQRVPGRFLEIRRGSNRLRKAGSQGGRTPVRIKIASGGPNCNTEKAKTSWRNTAGGRLASEGRVRLRVRAGKYLFELRLPNSGSGSIDLGGKKVKKRSRDGGPEAQSAGVSKQRRQPFYSGESWGQKTEKGNDIDSSRSEKESSYMVRAGDLSSEKLKDAGTRLAEKKKKT